MSPRLRAAAVALLAAAALHVPAAHAARIKCWTNNQGVRECGNVVPPEYAQKGHEELNKQGMTVEKQARAKTREELEEEERQAAAAAASQAEADRLARIQEARDRVLLDTFTTEEDLVLAHRGRLAAIDSRIKHTERLLGDLRNELEGFKLEAAQQERSGQAVSPEVSSNIARVEQQISQNHSFIESRHQEKVDLERQFQEDLARYRQLKGTAAK
jgi:hypothetical protein